MTNQQIREAVEEAQKPLVSRVEQIARQRTLLLVVTMLSLITAGVAVLYGINRERAFQDQLNTNQQVVCATAKNTALSPRREPLAGESRNHYLNRLEAQREQLLVVGDLRCPSLPGFATFPYLRAKAINEIEVILRRLAPEKLKHALGVNDDTSAPATAAPENVAANVLPSTSTPADAGGNDGGSGPRGGGASPGGSSPHPSPSPPQHHPPPPGTGDGDGGSESSPVPAPSGEAPREEAPDAGAGSGESAAKPGIVGNPGGVLGEVVCATNKLGLPVCAE